MSSNKVQTLKGFRDFLPQEALKREWLRDKIKEVFELWGYDPLETPTLEYLEVFEGQIGEDEKLFFKFKDVGGRNVALRYDQTVPTSRVVGQYFQKMPMPFRRYQIQPAFRAEKPQKGRFREFLQADADIFGSSSPLADSEVIALSLDIYRKLGFKKAKVLINDRTILKDLPYEAIVSIDKLKKIGRDGVLEEMVKKGILKEKGEDYLSFVSNLKPNETIKVILNYLEKLGFDKNWYEFSKTLARSFSYSTGPIWEVEVEGYDGGSVLGGERYDNLVKQITGRDIPGTGFAVGFDRTLEAADQLGLVPNLKTKTLVLVTIFNSDLVDSSINAVKALRTENISTELYPDSQSKLEKQLKYADQKGIPYAIIIGPDEVKSGKVVLKDLKNRTQETLSLDELLQKLTS